MNALAIASFSKTFSKLDPLEMVNIIAKPLIKTQIKKTIRNNNNNNNRGL